MKWIINVFGAVMVMALVATCSRSNKTKSEMDATYIHEGDTINPMEGRGEGTAGNKYMESADNADSTKEIQQDL